MEVTSKPTYEELEAENEQLLQQRDDLVRKLSQMADINNILYWSFEALKNKELFREEFVDNIRENVESILTPPKK